MNTWKFHLVFSNAVIMPPNVLLKKTPDAGTKVLEFLRKGRGDSWETEMALFTSVAMPMLYTLQTFKVLETGMQPSPPN